MQKNTLFPRLRKDWWLWWLSYLLSCESILDSILLDMVYGSFVFIFSDWAVGPTKLLTAKLAILAVLILWLVFYRNFCPEPLVCERWQPFLLLLISNLHECQWGHIRCGLEIYVVGISIFLLLNMRTLLISDIDRLLPSFWNQESQWLRGLDNLKIALQLLPGHRGLELPVWLPKIKGLPQSSRTFVLAEDAAGGVVLVVLQARNGLFSVRLFVWLLVHSIEVVLPWSRYCFKWQRLLVLDPYIAEIEVHLLIFRFYYGFRAAERVQVVGLLLWSEVEPKVYPWGHGWIILFHQVYNKV